MKHEPFAFPINPSLISTFLAVAQIGKIALAAKALHLSQPAVTAQISKLEKELEFPLFTRSVRGVRLTLEGESFLVYANRLAALLGEAVNLKGTGEVAGRLAIAASTTVGNHLLPEIITSFAKAYPRVSIQLEVISTGEVIEKIHQGKVSLGLVEGLSRAAQIRLERFLPDEIFVVAHPELRKKISKLEDLKKFPLIWRERGSGTRAVVEQALRRHFRKDEISYQYELGSTEAVKLAVMEKLGIGFLSRWSIQDELGTGKLGIVPLEALRIERQFSWVYPSGALKATDQMFVNFAKQFLGKKGLT